MNRFNAIARLQRFEGSSPHMYRCTGGEVTIGVGHAIHTAADAAKLCWHIGGSLATPEQACEDFARVAAAAKGWNAARYASLTQCRMRAADIEALLQADVERFEAGLAIALPHWSSYPEPAQAAFFDMGFNLGFGGLLKFRELLAAANSGRWEAAAEQCHRAGIAEARNTATAQLFREAAAAV